MVELTRKQLILAKIETIYRTDPTPTNAANAIEAYDVTITPQKPPIERGLQSASLSRLPSILGEKFVEVSFKTPMFGSGTAGTAPRHGALLRACAIGETIISSTSVTYAPVSSSMESVTLWCFIGGRVHKVTGCMGSVKGVCTAGQFKMYEFAFSGYLSAEPTVAAIPTPTFDTTTAVCKNGTLSYNSKTTLIASVMDWDIANVVSKRPSLSDANAVAGFTITDRKPIASFNPETQIETSYNFRADVLTTPRELSYVVGSILTITIPKFNPLEPSYEDDNGILRDKITGEMAQTTGNDEISLVYVG